MLPFNPEDDVNRGKNLIKHKYEALIEHINQLTKLKHLSLEFVSNRWESFPLSQVDLRALAWIEKFRFDCDAAGDVLYDSLITYASTNNHLIHLEYSYFNERGYLPDLNSFYLKTEKGQAVARRFTFLHSLREGIEASQLALVSTHFTSLTALFLRNMSLTNWSQMRHLTSLPNLLHLSLSFDAHIGEQLQSEKHDLYPLTSVRSLKLIMLHVTHRTLIQFGIIGLFPRVQLLELRLSIWGSICGGCREQVRDDSEEALSLATVQCQREIWNILSPWRDTLKRVVINQELVELQSLC